jgi:hypothetical protein
MRLREAGSIATRRVLLVGFEDEVTQFSTDYEPWRLGMHVSAASVLRGREHLKEDLALASAHARILRPDDIFILVPWSHKETIDECINAFLRIPASIHLGPERVLDRFMDAQVCKIGQMVSLNLVHRPLSPAEVFVKRALDVTLAGMACLALLPFFFGRRDRHQMRQSRPGDFPAEPLRLQSGTVSYLQVSLDDDARRRRQSETGDAKR